MARLPLLGLPLGIVLGLVAVPPVRADEPPPPLNLSRVEGAEEFPGSDGERERLVRNGFVVLPRFHKQIFSPYIGGRLPYYVTTDSAHHTYHVLFEAALKEMEGAVSGRVREMVRALAERLLASPPTTPRLRDEAHPLALAHVAVADRLLGGPGRVPEALEVSVLAEVGLVTAAAGIAPSPLFGEPEDYALYRPRGFYSGTPDLEAYFRAVTWFGRRGFHVADPRETAAAVVLVRAIRADAAVAKGFEQVDALLRGFLGPADDLTVAEYATALDGVLAGDGSDAAVEARLPQIREALARLRDPEINAEVLSPEDWIAFRARTKGLRLMPARFTPDAWLFQSLAENDRTRSLPSGLEVAHALGSARAGVLRAGQGEVGARAAAHTRERTEAFRGRLTGTHYGATLSAAALLLDGSSPLLGAGEAPAGAAGTPLLPAPLFRTAPWQERLLATGLAAWASVRHAGVLHAKPNVNYLVPMRQDLPGIVEPEPRFYAALASLARDVVARAEEAGAFRRDPKATLAEILPLLEALARDDTFSEADYARLQEHEQALTRLFPGDVDPQGDEFRATITKLKSWNEGEGAFDETLSAWVQSLGSTDTAAYLGEFAQLMERLRDIAERELRGEPLGEKDEELVREYGKTIAGLNFFGGNSWLSPDRQMGLVVDVASDPQRGLRLQAAVGSAMEIYVALPLRGGGHRLYQGGVYGYYEFTEASPLTDDAWRERIADRTLPAPPAWTSSYVPWPDAEDLVSRVGKGEMPEQVESLYDERIGRAMIEQIASAPMEERERVQWLVEQLAVYGRGALHDVVLETLLGVLHRPHPEDDADIAAAAAESLAHTARPADRKRLLSLIAAPPAAAPGFAERLVEALLGMDDLPTADEIAPLLEHADRRMRLYAVELLAGPLEWRHDTVSEADRSRLDRLVARLANEADAEVAEAILWGVADSIDFVKPTHAEALAPRLASPEPALRAAAATLLGLLQSASHANDLFALLADREDRVAAAAAEALGGALGSPDADDTLRARAVRELAALFPMRDWSVAVACLKGLGRLRGAEAAAVLARIAADADVDPSLRGIAVGSLAETGEVAIPHLFRLAFDETETGSSVNSHRTRLCDEAVKHLDKLLGGRFGWSEYSVPDPEDIPKILQAVRTEARRLGHVK